LFSFETSGNGIPDEAGAVMFPLPGQKAEILRRRHRVADAILSPSCLRDLLWKRRGPRILPLRFGEQMERLDDSLFGSIASNMAPAYRWGQLSKIRC
jgi:hypothetical protein